MLTVSIGTDMALGRHNKNPNRVFCRAFQSRLQES